LRPTQAENPQIAMSTLEQLGELLLDERVEGAREPPVGARVVAEEEEVGAPRVEPVGMLGAVLLDEPAERVQVPGSLRAEGRFGRLGLGLDGRRRSGTRRRRRRDL